MTPNSPDDLDRLLSDFFKAQMKNPWPNAPLAQTAEPSELATRPEAPRNEPAPARRDQTARAKFTLAASVAFLLGTAFYMSDGYAPTARPVAQPATNGTGPSLFKGSEAKGTPGGVLETISKDKGNGGAPKVDPSQFE
jgi:hypothetical protein